MTTVTAPGSVANLGPGFDVLALAVDLRLEVELEEADRWMITSDGRPVDEATATLIREVAGEGPRAVFIRSEIPVGRGLGSSAALRVAAGAAEEALWERPDPQSVFRRAAHAEGHPDNAAAAVYGGLVAVTASGGILRLPVHPSIRLVIGVPGAELSTDGAREVVPADVGRDVAVRTAARITALVEGLRSADETALAAAAGDEIHEIPRTGLSPLTAQMVEAAGSAGALHAAWSGSGPSAVALVTEGTVDRVADALWDVVGDDGEVLAPEIDRRGMEVL